MLSFIIIYQYDIYAYLVTELNSNSKHNISEFYLVFIKEFTYLSVSSMKFSQNIHIIHSDAKSYIFFCLSMNVVYNLIKILLNKYPIVIICLISSTANIFLIQIRNNVHNLISVIYTRLLSYSL